VFHFDNVTDLGTFLEVEVTNAEGSLNLEKMQTEINKYLQFFELEESQFISASYSDLLMDMEKRK
jgi:adenylate cyclase class 2